MVSQKIKWSKLALILTLVGLFCFMIAGAAMAGTSTMVIKADGQSKAYTGCENVSYTFELEDSIVSGLINSDCLAGGFDIIIDFLDGVNNADFYIHEGQSVPVKVLCDGNWYFAQPTPAVSNNGHAVLSVPDLKLPANKPVTKIFVGDGLQDLKVDNPCLAKSYCITVTIDSGCVDFSITNNWVVESTPYTASINVTCPTDDLMACGNCLVVSGYIYDCGQYLVPNQPVTIKIDGAVVGTGVTGATGSNRGYYNISLPSVVLSPGTHTAKVETASGCGDIIWATTEFTAEKNEPVRLEVTVKSTDGVDGELRFNKCNEVTVCILDDCGFPAAFDDYMTVYFSAFTPGDPPIVAGHFYEYCPGERLSGQINSVTLYPGESCVTLTMIPLVQGPITIEATVNGLKGTVVANSIAPASIAKFEITPLVTDNSGKPRAGWPLAVKILLDRTSSEDYNVTFTSDQGGITFDNEMIRAFGCMGDDEAMFPFCTDKQYYFLYPDQSVIGKTLNISVDVGGIAAGPLAIGPFVSPVEMQRTFKPDAWNVFSTPKWLADDCEESPEYARFFELLPFNPVVLTYNNWGWQYVPNWKEVDPLRGYYVLAPQIEEWETTNTTVDFVFARATSPDYAYPPNDMWYEDTTPGCCDLPIEGPGWNTVGVAVSPEIERSLTRQSDTAGQAFGSMYRSFQGSGGDMLVWNPGTKLGNVNTDFTTIALSDNSFEGYLYDPFAPVYNGDVYWVFGGILQNYSANIGLDMIEWDGGFRQLP